MQPHVPDNCTLPLSCRFSAPQGALVSAFARSVAAHVKALLEPNESVWDPEDAKVGWLACLTMGHCMMRGWVADCVSRRSKRVRNKTLRWVVTRWRVWSLSLASGGRCWSPLPLVDKKTVVF